MKLSNISKLLVSVAAIMTIYVVSLTPSEYQVINKSDVASWTLGGTITMTNGQVLQTRETWGRAGSNWRSASSVAVVELR